MGTTKWTDEQKQAIETRRCNLLVSAAAGSGKTAVLVERIIQIITSKDNPVDIDKLLVVTFTSAAAAEMRERIAMAITNELEKDPSSKNLQRQLTLLSRANITTMHSFCLDVIKNNFHVIELDPAFRILDETEGVLIKNEVLEELFEDKYEEGNQEFLDLVEAYSNSKDDEKLREIVLNLYRFSMSGPWPEKWLKEKSEEFNIATLEQLDNSSWMNVLKESIYIELQGLIELNRTAIELCSSTEGLEPYLDAFNDDASILVSIENALDKDIKSLYNSIYNISFSKLKVVRKNKVSDVNIQDRVKAIRDSIKKKIKKFQEDIFVNSPEDMLIAIKNSYPFMKKLCDIVIEFKERFDNAKKERGTLDFNDLEHLCLKILSNEEIGVAASYREYFDEVLVDEYQDSNNVQEAIIDLVSRKKFDNPNVFMVGDVKQSIYRFRQAKPELFLEKYNTYSNTEGNNRKIQLYKNFRSRLEVVNGVNYIFKELMSKTVGELEYTEDEALNLGASYPKVDDDNTMIGGEIELHILDKTNELEDKKDDSEEEEINSINLEARIVANRIKELIAGKDGKVYKVLDKHTGKYRKVTYKDIVILLRATKNWAEIFLDEVGAEGIPIYADTGTGYFESIEIRTVISLLKIIDNPMQDIPMIAVLRSPIIGLSSEELANIRLVNKDNYYYDNIKLISESREVDQDLSYKCREFLTKLNRWREKALYTPIDEFIWYVYDETAYYGYVGAMPNGVLRQANLRILFQRAKQYEETSFKGLFNFINFIDKLRKSSGDMGSAKILGENEDVVRIMSIHKSKGLEFPVVFLCGSGKQFNLMDLNSNILYHDELGLGPDYVDIEKRFSLSTIAKEAIKQKIKLETLSEEMRILYVAFTRAKEKLIITGSTKSVDKLASNCCLSASFSNNNILPSEVIKAKSYLEWICLALCKHKDGEVLRDLSSIQDVVIIGDDSKWNIKLWKSIDLLVDNSEENVDNLNNSVDILNKTVDKNKEICAKLGYVYKYEDVTRMKSNFSVSDLKKKDYEEEELNSTELYRTNIELKPRFLQEEKGLSSSEIGTAMHFVMQSLDLDKVNNREEIKEQLKSFLKLELISEEEYRAIAVDKLMKYFESNLGKRVLEAHERGSKVLRELPFYTEINVIDVDKSLNNDVSEEKVRLQGVIDCFFQDRDNKIVLLDYKTDYIPKGGLNEFIDKYRAQLKYYKEALEKITECDVKECYLYSFYINKEILVEI